MPLLKLTEKCNLVINTLMEKQALLMLLEQNVLSELRIGSTLICVYGDSIGQPDNCNGRVRVNIKYVDKNHNIIEEDDSIDVYTIKQQLTGYRLRDDIDGDYSYIDWNEDFVTISDTGKGNRRIIFSRAEFPFLSSSNTDIFGSVYPNVQNLGFDEDGMFNVIITSKTTGAKVRLFIDPADSLDSYFTEE